MALFLTAEAYPISETGVRFRTSNAADQQVFDCCEALCKENIDVFGDKKVLKEGAKYNGVWLETQPIGGEMYAKRDMEIAVNNQLVFFENQRIDGRLPGMITFRLPYQGLTPHYSWMQGNFLPFAALKVAYLIGKNRTFLELLYRTLRKFDEYLWAYRDSDGDGCLEAWCVWDTGEDNCTQLMVNGVHPYLNGLWVGEKAPYGVAKLPFESAQYMAYSYANRAVLAEVSALLENGEEAQWRARAQAVQQKMKDYLWDAEKKACYDRDCDNIPIDCLSQSNIKCMHLGAFTQEMADAFICTHLMNKEAFATYVPLPGIAANNPYFYLSAEQNNCTPEMLDAICDMVHGDVMDNSWSGPCGGLTQQRLPDALLNYGHHAELGWFGRRWIGNLGVTGKYVQQYNPFTGAAAPGLEGYGPTMLAALEYFALMYGVEKTYDRLVWSSVCDHTETEYTQHLYGHNYTVKRAAQCMTACCDDTVLFTVTSGVRVYTNESGAVQRVFGIAENAQQITLTTNGVTCTAVIHPNEEMEWCDGQLKTVRRVPYTAVY